MGFDANGMQPTVGRNCFSRTPGERRKEVHSTKGRVSEDGSFSPGESNLGKLAAVRRVLCGLVLWFGFVLIWPKEPIEGRANDRSKNHGHNRLCYQPPSIPGDRRGSLGRRVLASFPGRRVGDFQETFARSRTLYRVLLPVPRTRHPGKFFGVLFI